MLITDIETSYLYSITSQTQQTIDNHTVLLRKGSFSERLGKDKPMFEIEFKEIGLTFRLYKEYPKVLTEIALSLLSDEAVTEIVEEVLSTHINKISGLDWLLFIREQKQASYDQGKHDMKAQLRSVLL